MIDRKFPDHHVFPHTDEQYVAVSIACSSELESRRECLEEMEADAALLRKYEPYAIFEIVSGEDGAALYVPISHFAAAMTVFTCYVAGDDMATWAPFISPRKAAE